MRREDALPPMTRDEERRAWAETRPPHSPAVIDAARDRIARSVWPMVLKVAARYARGNPNLRDELEGVGLLAVVSAMGNYVFNPAKGNAFWNYARRAASQEMAKCLSVLRFPFWVPPSVAFQGARRKAGEPSRISDAMFSAWEAALSATVYQEGETAADSALAAVEYGDDPKRHVDDADEIETAMRALGHRSREIVRRFTGLGGCPREHLTDVGASFGIGRTRTCRLYNESLPIMRDRLRPAGLT